MVVDLLVDWHISFFYQSLSSNYSVTVTLSVALPPTFSAPTLEIPSSLPPSGSLIVSGQYLKTNNRTLTKMEADARIEEADAIIDRRIAELEGRRGDPTGSKTSNVLSTGPGGSNNFNENHLDTANDGRVDRGASNHVNWDLHGIYDIDPDGRDSLPLYTELLNPYESQTSIGSLPAPISSSIRNNEPDIFENDPAESFSTNNANPVEYEVPRICRGYQSIPSTSPQYKVFNHFRDIQLSSSPETMEDEKPTSSMSYVPTRPPRARDFYNQQEPTVADLPQQVENSQLPPDEYIYDSHEKIFSGPLANPENQTVGPSSSDHGFDFQHQSWSSTTEAIPSRTNSLYQSSPSTCSPSNVSFPDVMRMKCEGPTSSQYPLCAPAHPSSANDSRIFDRQQPKQYCDQDKNASGSLHQVTIKKYFPRGGIIEQYSFDCGYDFQNQFVPSTTDANPSHSAKQDRWAPYSFNQRPLPAKQFRLDGKKLSPNYQQERFSRPVDLFHGISSSVQNQMAQDFDRESCFSNGTTFESNDVSIIQYNSLSDQQPVAQKLSVDFFDLGSFEKYVQKKEMYLKTYTENLQKLENLEKLEEGKIGRRRTEPVDEKTREMRAKNRGYRNKSVRNTIEELNKRIFVFVDRFKETEGIISYERLAEFSSELDSFLEGNVDDSNHKTFEAQKRRLLLSGKNSKSEKTVQKTWELFEKSKAELREMKKLKRRAEQQLEYDIACLDLIISKAPELSNLSFEFARIFVNKIAPKVSWNAERVMEWVHRNGKTKEWEELKSFVEANPALRHPNFN
ncbi:unnamed protein product [Caenorhabditis nigoni]